VKSMRVLLTGADGFVGRAFHSHLGAGGHEVLPVDTKRGLDARDVFRNGRAQDHVDLLIHAAAIVGGREKIDGAPLALASNLELDAAMFQWALAHHPGHILYFSSSAVYPVKVQSHGLHFRLSEDLVDPALRGSQFGMPDQLYGWAKLTGENLAHRYRESVGTISVVRPFSGYGSTQDDKYPFPAMVDRAIKRADPFKVWGDGTQTRDFIHISDIVYACMRMVQNKIAGPVNLGTGIPTTMDQLAELCMKTVGYSAPIEHDEFRPSGVSYRVADTTLLRQFYEPRVSLAEGVKQAVMYRRGGGR
jgi:UDP-glucose 4-epimerase